MKHIIFTSSEALVVSKERFEKYKGDKMFVNGNSVLYLDEVEFHLEPELDLLKVHVPSKDGVVECFYMSTRNLDKLYERYKKIKKHYNNYVNQEYLMDEIERLSYSLQKQREENCKLIDEKEQLLFEMANLAHKIEKLEKDLKRAREACKSLRLKNKSLKSVVLC